MSPDGKTLYVVNVGGNFISCLDLKTKTLTREWLPSRPRRRTLYDRRWPETDCSRRAAGWQAHDNSDPDETWDKPIAAVYYVAPKTQAVSKVADGLQFPNGLALSPDEKTLYVAESPLHRMTAISLPSGEKRVFGITETVGGGDGMRVDQKGFLYAAIFGEGFIAKISPRRQIFVRGRGPNKLGAASLASIAPRNIYDAIQRFTAREAAQVIQKKRFLTLPQARCHARRVVGRDVDVRHVPEQAAF